MLAGVALWAIYTTVFFLNDIRYRLIAEISASAGNPSIAIGQTSLQPLPINNNKEMMMRIIAMILGLSLASITTVADDHGGKMALEARQPDSTMNVTSVNVGTDQTTITASGKMGAYGKVYTTYNLTYGADRSSGFVEGNGRGVIDAETVVSGYFVGVWHREGSTIVMHNTVHVSDGSQNFDVIRFDARGETLQHQVYILK